MSMKSYTEMEVLMGCGRTKKVTGDMIELPTLSISQYSLFRHNYGTTDRAHPEP